MEVHVPDMARDVRVAIDENAPDTSLVQEFDADTLELEAMAESVLCDAVRQVELEAPSHLLERGHTFHDAAVTWTDGGRGWLRLPRDFMRLVVFRMSDWERTVTESITEDDPLYLRQSSRWKGIYGTVEKPVVAVVNRAEGLRLEFFSCESEDATVEQASYVPWPERDVHDCIDVSGRCYRAAVYRAAGIVLALLGDQRANTLVEMSKSMLE